MRVTENIFFSFPERLRDALALLADAEKRGVLLAGGTDLMAQWAAGVQTPARVISLRGVAGLDEIRKDGADWLVGAMVTHALIRDCLPLRRALPALGLASESVGATQIQAVGTIGGNAVNASPAGDTAPALLITGGTAMLASVRGRREVPLTAFWTGYRKTALEPDELLVGFRLPGRGRAVESFRKVGTRQAQAISKVMAAGRIQLVDGRIATAAIALGSVGPTAVRMPAVEEMLLGRAPDAKTAALAEGLAMETVEPIADIRSSAEYRRWVAGRLVRGIIEDLAAKKKKQQTEK